VFVSRSSDWTVEELRAAVAASTSLGEAIRRLGLRAAGGNPRSIQRWIERLDISTEHFVAPGAPGVRAKIPLSEILVERSTYSRTKLKERLFREGLKTRACEMCGQGEQWRGARMSLILDHINGVHDDNRLENLRIVCPNCAATLDTHCGRNRRRERPSAPCERCGAVFERRRPAQRFCSRACWTRGPRGVGVPGGRKVERPPYEQLLAEVRAEGRGDRTPLRRVRQRDPQVDRRDGARGGGAVTSPVAHGRSARSAPTICA
jgi:hypothetical protein